MLGARQIHDFTCNSNQSRQSPHGETEPTRYNKGVAKKTVFCNSGTAFPSDSHARFLHEGFPSEPLRHHRGVFAV